jgi:hypothetical protein
MNMIGFKNKTSNHSKENGSLSSTKRSLGAAYTPMTLSKKEVAQEMFGAGVYLGIQTFMDSLGDIKEIEQILKYKTKR